MSVVFEGRRDDYFPDLMSWAQEHGASCEGFAVANFGAEGYGLRATRDIKVSRGILHRHLFGAVALKVVDIRAGGGIVPVDSQEDAYDGRVGEEVCPG